MELVKPIIYQVKSTLFRMFCDVSGTLSTLLAAPPLNLDLACNGIPLSITIPTLSTVTSQDNTCKGCGQANLDIVVFSAFFQRKMHLTWGFFRFKFFFFFFLAKCI